MLWLVGGASALAFVAAMATGALAAYVARVVVTPPRKRFEDIRILSSNPSRVTLASTKDTRARGRYGLWFHGDAGYARIGEILSSSRETVTRELLSVATGKLGAARQARFSGWFYLHPAELGVPVEEVAIDTPVGSAPAWLVPAVRPGGDWVIQVHGRGVTRAECIRAIPVFRDAGYTSLLISYRNDGVAPASADRRYGLGGTEWQDVEAALDFAVSRGAKNVVLMGWSMGGATSVQAAFLARHRELVRGIVLESPVVDWRSVLDFQASEMRVPWTVRFTALALLGNAWGRIFTGLAQPIDLERLNIVKRARELTLPMLIMHSADDGYVPADASRELAALRPDLIRYEEFSGARHAKLWNYDPERFGAVISEWLSDLRKATARRGRSPRRAEAARG